MVLPSIRNLKFVENIFIRKNDEDILLEIYCLNPDPFLKIDMPLFQILVSSDDLQFDYSGKVIGIELKNQERNVMRLLEKFVSDVEKFDGRCLMFESQYKDTIVVTEMHNMDITCDGGTVHRNFSEIDLPSMIYERSLPFEVDVIFHFDQEEYLGMGTIGILLDAIRFRTDDNFEMNDTFFNECERLKQLSGQNLPKSNLPKSNSLKIEI